MSSARGGAIVAVVAVLVYVADRWTKIWAMGALAPGESRELLGSFLRLHLIFNPGAAFSLGTGVTWLFTLVQASVSVVVIVLASRVRWAPWAVVLGLILAGAAGNLTDRLTRPPGFGVGHVVDFLELPHWPIFNVADSAVVTGACLAVLLILRGHPFLAQRPSVPSGSAREGAAGAPAESAE